MPNYIMKEAIIAISITTHKAATHLQHFCAPVIHPITGKSITTYKNWQKIQLQGKCEIQNLERNE